MADQKIKLDPKALPQIQNHIFDQAETRRLGQFMPKPGEVLLSSAVAYPQPLYSEEPYVIQDGSETEKFREVSLNPVVKSALDNLVIGTFGS